MLRTYLPFIMLCELFKLYMCVCSCMTTTQYTFNSLNPQLTYVLFVSVLYCMKDIVS